MRIQPVILCGGSGTRLYPLSTPETPKQFIRLGSKGTLLDETIRRISLAIRGHELPLLIMNKNHASEVTEYADQIIYEDYSNDTAVAVGIACKEIMRRFPNENITMLMLPADHYIYNDDCFVKDIAEGINCVTEDNIVLFGIQPTAPETKYGYIIPSDTGISFKEKPDIMHAHKLIQQKALWNSGIFGAKVNTVMKYLASSKYNIMDWVNNPREGKAPSFDVAVLQECANIHAHHCSGWSWSDVGTWESLMSVPEIQDEMRSDATSILTECSNVHVLNRGTGNVVVVGCHDIVVVVNKGNILVMPTKGDYNNHLKEIVGRLSTV